jgi:hypothetical protein
MACRMKLFPWFLCLAMVAIPCVSVQSFPGDADGGGVFTVNDQQAITGVSITPFYINDSGFVVGFSAGNGISNHNGFLWFNGVICELDNLIDPATGYHVFQARGINNLGQITCWGIIENDLDTVTVLLLTPPELQTPSRVVP